MFEEPFRWMEAISTRHSYVREKLHKGQPVISVPYNEGALILGFSPQPGKIFEIYDRIALGGLGHPADVEKLRMTLLDMAHLEGFNRSAQDVTIARMLQFGLAPVLKQNFEEVMRAPYLIQLLLTEVDGAGNPRFYRLNYDGYWETFSKGAVIAGNQKVAQNIQEKIESQSFESYDLHRALCETCKLWQEGREAAEAGEGEEEKDEDNTTPQNLKEAFEKWNLEAAVLCRKTAHRALYRTLSSEEVEHLKAAVVNSS